MVEDKEVLTLDQEVHTQEFVEQQEIHRPLVLHKETMVVLVELVLLTEEREAAVEQVLQQYKHLQMLVEQVE